MTLGSLPEEGMEPFPQSGLAALLFSAAGDAPNAVLIGDDDGTLTAGEIARRITLVAAHFRSSASLPANAC